MGIDFLNGILFTVGMAGAAYLIWKIFDLLDRLHALEGEAANLRGDRKFFMKRIHNLEDEIWRLKNPPLTEADFADKDE